MKVTKLLLAFALLFVLPIHLFAQVNESFEDGDFTKDPAWSGTSGSWIINGNSQLQSSNTLANSTFYITTASTLTKATQWEFSVTLSFNTSSVNYVDVFLTASDSALAGNKNTGYFVRIGNTDDDICLYRKDSAATTKKIIDGTNGVTNTSSNKLKIKVIRDADKKFHLYYIAGNDANFVDAGTITDSTYTSSSYFGFLVRQSTSSFFQKHSFYDILVQPYMPGTIYVPQHFDVIIDEIMADPSPSVGLPNAEYIELKNLSKRDMNLKGWKLLTASASSAAFPEYNLPGDSFVIVTSASNASLMSAYGKVLPVSSFPALDNDGADLSLVSKEGVVLHAVSYRPGWYQSALKKDGGWSLEMIDTHYPCLGQNNWKASTHQSGGTPGKKNAVDAVNKDQEAPVVTDFSFTDSVSIMLHFNESLDTSGGVGNSNFIISPAITIKSVSVIGADLTQVQLKLATPPEPSKVYSLSFTGIKDCVGNVVSDHQEFSIGLPQLAKPGDLVINEVLFNPKPRAYDYVELLNRGSKILDASQLFIANRNSTGVVSSSKKLSNQPFYILPGDYIVITEDAASLQQSYMVKDPGRVLVLSSLPSFPDDKGTVVILNPEGAVLDELTYSKDWHFALLANEEGVALERIDPDATTQDKDNWHSAASTAGYGTPTYKNSQYGQKDDVAAAISITPKVFSPDNDGYDDIATINYELSESGYVANIQIFDASGRLVRSLVKNATMGMKGYWNWDGLDERKQKLPIGPYIIFTEIFNLQGKKKQFKNVVVLARKI